MLSYTDLLYQLIAKIEFTIVQLGYHIGYNESENVNFSGRSYEAKVTTYLF